MNAGVQAVSQLITTTTANPNLNNPSTTRYTTPPTTLPTMPSTTQSLITTTTATSFFERIREAATIPPNAYQHFNNPETTSPTESFFNSFISASTTPSSPTPIPGDVYYNNVFGAERLSAELTRNKSIDQSFESLDALFPEALTANLANISPILNSSCSRINIMGTIVEDSTPYLFPFIIEYSLIGAAVIYVMWKHIGRNPRYAGEEDLEHRLEVMLSRRAVALAQANSGRVDCVGASKGLFFGLLLLVGSLICLILFFVLVRHPQLSLLAIYLADVSHSALIAFSLLAILIGFIRYDFIVNIETEIKIIFNFIIF